MVLSLRKRPHMYLGEDSEDEGSSEDIQDAPVTRSRRVKRRSASPDALPTLAFAYTEREHKFKPKPPWYHVEELTFHTAETRPNHTAASVVAFIKTNAVSIEYHKTKGRTAVFRKKYLTLRLPDGRSAIVSADYYRLPTLFLSHFLWAYVWRVITRGEAFEKEMFNLLHLARLLRALVEGAIRAAPQYNLAEGQDICTWRFLPFDRALIRMSYDDFLLPIDGYGDRYNDEFWKRNQDTKYRPRQDIEHRNWKKIVTSRNEWLAPLEDEELQSFDAAAFAECLRIRDGVPIWVPTSEAGRAATERLKAKYSDVRSEAAQSTLQATAEASAGVVVQGIVTTDLERPEPVSSPCAATERSDGAATITLTQRRPRVPLPTRRKQASVSSAYSAGPLPPTPAATNTPPAQSPQVPLPTISTYSTRPNQTFMPQQGPLRVSPALTSTGGAVASTRPGPRDASPAAAPCAPANISSQATSVTTTSSSRAATPPRTSSSRSSVPRTLEVNRVSELEKEGAVLRATVIAHAEYRAFAARTADAARQRELRMVEEIAQLRREAAEYTSSGTSHAQDHKEREAEFAKREAQFEEREAEFAKREAQFKEREAHFNAREAQFLQGEANCSTKWQEREAKWEAHEGDWQEREKRWDAERAELIKELAEKAKALARVDKQLAEQKIANAALRSEVGALQMRMSNAARSLGVDLQTPGTA